MYIRYMGLDFLNMYTRFCGLVLDNVVQVGVFVTLFTLSSLTILLAVLWEQTINKYEVLNLCACMCVVC